MMRLLSFLLFLAAFTGVTMAVDQATAAALPAALRPWTGLLAAMLITLGLSNIWSLARGYGQGDSSRSALLSRARAGRPPARDGPILATGVVRTEGPPLISPITGQPCAAYQYRMFKRERYQQDEWRTRVFYWGYASVPFRLDTASESLRVMAMPRFVGDAPQYGDVPEAIAHAEIYIAATRFETGEVQFKLGAALDLVDSVFTEQRLVIRHDGRDAAAPATLDGLRIEEHVLPVGATASAWAQWSAERRAIVPGALMSETPGIAMVNGPPGSLLGTVAGPPSSATAVAIAAVVLLAIGGALVWAARAGYIAQVWASITALS